jgi:hypothetical protein
LCNDNNFEIHYDFTFLLLPHKGLSECICYNYVVTSKIILFGEGSIFAIQTSYQSTRDYTLFILNFRFHEVFQEGYKRDLLHHL